MTKYVICLLILSLQGCTVISDFDSYEFNESDSSIVDGYDSSTYDTSIDIEPDSNIVDSGVSKFPVLEFNINGQNLSIETSTCFSCKVDDDCAENETCNSGHCFIPCTYMDSFCNITNSRNMRCIAGSCIPEVGCNNWNKGE